MPCQQGISDSHSLLEFSECLCDMVTKPECTKIARFSAVAAAIFTAPGKIALLFEAPRCAISSAKKIAILSAMKTGKNDPRRGIPRDILLCGKNR